MGVMANARGAWIRIVAALVGALGLLLAISGVVQGRAAWLFGGGMFIALAAAAWLHALAMRPGADDAQPSAAEASAWHMVGIGLAAVLVLGVIPLGAGAQGAAPWLLFGTYAVLVVFLPAFRRQFVEHRRRWREITPDERDLAFRAEGDRLARRALELSLVALAATWALLPELFRTLREPLHIAALLLVPVLAANTLGEARVARLYWRDRR